MEIVQHLVEAAQVPAALGGDRDDNAAAVARIRCPLDEIALGQLVEDADMSLR